MRNTNFVCIVGTLVRKPQSFQAGEHKKVSFTVLEKQTYNGREKIEYIPCVAWNILGDIAERLEPEMLVTITGKIKTDSYERDGKREYKTFVGVENIVAGMAI